MKRGLRPTCILAASAADNIVLDLTLRLFLILFSRSPDSSGFDCCCCCADWSTPALLGSFLFDDDDDDDCSFESDCLSASDTFSSAMCMSLHSIINCTSHFFSSSRQYQAGETFGRGVFLLLAMCNASMML